MVKKAFQDSNLIEIKGNPTASVATIGELKEVFAGETGDVVVAVDDIQDASDVGKSLLKSSTAAAARTAIGAGTSNLSIGTTAGTAMAGNTALLKVGTAATDAKAGNYKPTAEDISNASTLGQNFIKAADAATARGLIGAGTSNLVIGTSATQAAAGNHTHAASTVSKTSMFDGDTSTNVQEALLLLAQKIAALENPTP